MSLHGPLALMRAGDTLSFYYSAVFGATARVCDGIASFCGANWPGKTFSLDSWKPACRCRLTAAKAHFFVVGTLPSVRRPGYVVEGDWVEAIGLVNESSAAWLLARYVGKRRTTACLLERDALECHEGL